MAVKQKKRGRPTRGDDRLTRDHIVDCAKQRMLQENKGMTIRGLASHLKVDPMAIYHYFDNKAKLLEAITVSIMQEIYLPSGERDWKNELKQLCSSYLTLLSVHPGLLETLLSMEVEIKGPAEVFRDRFDLAVASLELEDKRKEDAMSLLVDYIHGAALAMHCAKAKDAFKVTDIEGPLNMCLSAIEYDTEKR